MREARDESSMSSVRLLSGSNFRIAFQPFLGELRSMPYNFIYATQPDVHHSMILAEPSSNSLAPACIPYYCLSLTPAYQLIYYSGTEYTPDDHTASLC